MNENEKQKFISYLSLKGELNVVQKNGTNLFLDGITTDADHIASICVFNESTDYMRDYSSGGSDTPDTIAFDKVHNG